MLYQGVLYHRWDRTKVKPRLSTSRERETSTRVRFVGTAGDRQKSFTSKREGLLCPCRITTTTVSTKGKVRVRCDRRLLLFHLHLLPLLW